MVSVIVIYKLIAQRKSQSSFVTRLALVSNVLYDSSLSSIGCSFLLLLVLLLLGEVGVFVFVIRNLLVTILLLLYHCQEDFDFGQMRGLPQI